MGVPHRKNLMRRFTSKKHSPGSSSVAKMDHSTAEVTVAKNEASSVEMDVRHFEHYTDFSSLDTEKKERAAELVNLLSENDALFEYGASVAVASSPGSLSVCVHHNSMVPTKLSIDTDLVREWELPTVVTDSRRGGTSHVVHLLHLDYVKVTESKSARALLLFQPDLSGSVERQDHTRPGDLFVTVVENEPVASDDYDFGVQMWTLDSRVKPLVLTVHVNDEKIKTDAGPEAEAEAVRMWDIARSRSTAMLTRAIISSVKPPNRGLPAGFQSTQEHVRHIFDYHMTKSAKISADSPDESR